MSVEISPDLLAAQHVARLQALAQLLAGGAVVCYPAPRPQAGGAASWPALARIPFAQGVGTIADGALSIIAPIEGQVIQSGEIAWARVETAGGVWLFDCNASDLQLDRTVVLAGAFVRLLEAHFA